MLDLRHKTPRLLCFALRLRDSITCHLTMPWTMTTPYHTHMVILNTQISFHKDNIGDIKHKLDITKLYRLGIWATSNLEPLFIFKMGKNRSYLHHTIHTFPPTSIDAGASYHQQRCMPWTYLATPPPTCPCFFLFKLLPCHTNLDFYLAQYLATLFFFFETEGL